MAVGAAVGVGAAVAVAAGAVVAVGAGAVVAVGAGAVVGVRVAVGAGANVGVAVGRSLTTVTVGVGVEAGADVGVGSSAPQAATRVPSMMANDASRNRRGMRTPGRLDTAGTSSYGVLSAMVSSCLTLERQFRCVR